MMNKTMLPPLPPDKVGDTLTKDEEIAELKKAMASLKKKYMKTVVRVQRTAVEDKVEKAAVVEWEKEFLAVSGSMTAADCIRKGEKVAGNRRSDIFFILSVLGLTDDLTSITDGIKGAHYYNTSCQFLAPVKHKQLDKRENYLTCTDWHSHYNCEVVLHPFFVGDMVRINMHSGPFRGKTGVIEQIVGAETVSVQFEEKIDGVCWKEKQDFDVDNIDLVARSESNKRVAAVECVVVVWKFDGFQTHSLGYCKAAVPIDASMAVPFEGWLELKKNRHQCKEPTFLKEWAEVQLDKREEENGVPHLHLPSSAPAKLSRRRPRAATLAAEKSTSKRASFVVPSPKLKGKRHSLPLSPKRGDDGKTYVFVRGMFYDPSHSMAFESDRLRRRSHQEMSCVRDFVKSKARRYSALERDYLDEANAVASLQSRENEALVEARARLSEALEDSRSRLKSEETTWRKEIEDAKQHAETLDVAFDMLREQSEEKFSNARDACVKLRGALDMAKKRARARENFLADEMKEANNEASRLCEALEGSKREREQIEESTRVDYEHKAERLKMEEMASRADLSALRDRLHLEEIELHGKLANADRESRAHVRELDVARSKYEVRLQNKLAAKRTQELLMKKLRTVKHSNRRLQQEASDLTSRFEETQNALVENRNERECELRAIREATRRDVESLRAQLSLSECERAETAEDLERQRAKIEAERALSSRTRHERSETFAHVESELVSEVEHLRDRLVEAKRNSFALQTMRRRIDAERREFEIRVERENTAARTFMRELDESNRELCASRKRERANAVALERKTRQASVASTALRTELARRIDLRSDLHDERARVEFFVDKIGLEALNP